MPTRPVPLTQLQEALDLGELFGTGRKALKAGATTIPARTLDGRIARAILMGMRPTVRKDAPRLYQRQRLGRMHLIIPDVQARPGVPLQHLGWVGNYIAEKRPDVIVCIGDFADMDSLSTYDRGTLKAEGKRLKADLECARVAMDTLCKPFLHLPDYRPEMHLTQGNHEERAERFANEHPYLEGIIGTHMLKYEEWGWKVHPFLEVVTIDGVEYSHYFKVDGSIRPISSARALLNKRHCSAIMGHNQKTDVAFQPTTHQWSIFCGICNLHDEDYLGPQGNTVRRQILVLHEVEEGRFDPMFVSLKFLEKSYS